MKTINVPLEDDEYRKLVRKKGDLSWHDFILGLTKKRPKRPGLSEIKREFKKHFPHSKVDESLLRLVGAGGQPGILPGEEKRELAKIIAGRHPK